MSLVTQLARICLRPTVQADRTRAALHVAAWTGTAALGATTPVADSLRRGFAPPGVSRQVQYTGAASEGWEDLLFEASLGCLHEMDDFHRAALVHPGPIVIPAALYVARRCAADGGATLQAIVRGYEAMIRVGESVGAEHYAYWHNTSTCGVIGAAAATASLLGLDTIQTAHAFALALTQSSGLWQIRLEPCDAKPWHTARSTQTGIQAALLAQAGIKGPAHALEGEKGFYAATCRNPLPERIAMAPQAPWKIFETTFKPWAACRHTHPAIDATLALAHDWHTRQKNSTHPARTLGAIPLEAIAAVHVHTYGDAIAFCDRVHPGNTLEARFSLQHALAITLLKGEPALADFLPDAIQNPAYAHLRTLITVTANAQFSSCYPAHFGAEVCLQLKDGSRLSHTVRDTLGDPERPLSSDQVLNIAKLLMTQAGWTDESASRHLSQIMTLEQAVNLGDCGVPDPARLRL